MRGWIGWMVVGGMVLSLSATSVWAANSADTAAGDDQMTEAMGHDTTPPVFMKLGRGLSNLLGGWLEVPATIDQHYTTTDTAGSMLAGLGHGLVRAVMRTGVGAYEAVSFLIPCPEDYAPILPTLGYFNTHNRAKRLPLE